jgi:hypothetical protein
MSVCWIYWPQSRTSRLESFLRMGVAMGIISLRGRTTFGQSGPPQIVPGWTFCIHVYKSAEVSSGILNSASKEAARILLTAGVPTEWHTSLSDVAEASKTHMSGLNVPQRANPTGRSCLILTIVRGVSRKAFPGALGFALPHAQNSVDVTVFYDRIERIQPRPVSAGATAPQILGFGMAHEIGHILLGSNQHSSSGIMKGPWGQAEFERLARGWLGFTPEQSVLMAESAFRRAASSQLAEGKSKTNASVSHLEVQNSACSRESL